MTRRNGLGTRPYGRVAVCQGFGYYFSFRSACSRSHRLFINVWLGSSAARYKSLVKRCSSNCVSEMGLSRILVIHIVSEVVVVAFPILGIP